MKAIPIKDVIKAVDGKLLYGNIGWESNRSAFSGFPSMQITSVSINSRESKEGSLFIPIKGERYDAHDFMDSAFDNGAIATLTEYESIEINSKNKKPRKGKAYILVKNTKKALQALATYYRSLFSIPILGVTGSVGKTSTKEMLAAALGNSLKICKTKGNLNGQIGVALMMFELNKEHELAIIEMGVSERNEMEPLVKMVKPETAVITNIGVSHIGNFENQENIRKEKCHIIDYLKEDGGGLFVCGNDEWLKELANQKEVGMDRLNLAENTKERLKKVKVVTFGTGEDCNYMAENVRYGNDHTFFTLRVGNRTEEVELGVLGIHHVHNALAAFAVADRYGVPYQDVKQGLRNYKPFQMRGQIVEKDGIRIIDDTYNASPDSMKSGLQVLFATSCTGRRFAVLADVLELGDSSEECHREVGRHIVKLYTEGACLHALVTVGSRARYIAEEVGKVTKDIGIQIMETNEEAAEYLKHELKKGDLALVKGSRGMRMDEIIRQLITE